MRFRALQPEILRSIAELTVLTRFDVYVFNLVLVVFCRRLSCDSFLKLMISRICKWLKLTMLLLVYFVVLGIKRILSFKAKWCIDFMSMSPFLQAVFRVTIKLLKGIQKPKSGCHQRLQMFLRLLSIGLLIDSTKRLYLIIQLVATYAEVALLNLWAILLGLSFLLGLNVELEAYVDIFDVVYIAHVVYNFAV